MMSSYHTQNSRLLWMIIGGISIIVIIFLGMQWLLAQRSQPMIPVPNHPVTEKIAIPTQQDTPAEAPVTPDEPATAPIQLVEDNLSKQPLPTNNMLAKEEIAKLDDIDQQLKEQQQQLKQQHTDADTLLKLKEEQVKLLEAQIAAQK